MIAGLQEAGASIDAGVLAEYWSLKAAYAIVPNFQVFWLADAITQEATIPTSYVTAAVPYGLSLIVLALAIAIVLFQRREVG